MPGLPPQRRALGRRPMGRLDSRELAAHLRRLTAQHLRRHRRLVEAYPQPGDATQVQVEGRVLRNFCGNDYLGLSTHPALIDAAGACLRRWGVGAGASHLVTGHSHEHHALEEELAAFTGRERALLFSSGYLANVGVLSALASRGERIIADRLCHASLLDGALLSGARLRRYAHADVRAAERALEQRAALLVTDGVFSMDGDTAPLKELSELATARDATLVVDDAHGLGVLGARGRGTLEAAGVDARAIPVLIGTLGKAFGTFGAFVAGEAALVEHLLQHVRTYIYTTALPPAIAAATRAALRVADAEVWRRERLRSLVQRWRSAVAALGLPLSASQTPIQPLIVGDAARALQISHALFSAGFWVVAIRPPTVPAGSARLRISLSAAHAEADVDALAEALGRAWRSCSA
jgi:8-amino-7-oxononanoate synthase